MAQYFCLHEIFHHLAVSEKDISHNHHPDQRIISWYHIYPVFMVKEHARLARRSVNRENFKSN